MNQVQEAQMVVEFFTEAIEMTFQSKKEGRPIFKEIPWVKILNPGDNTTVIERPATNRDREKYPNAWARYENAVRGDAVGTPLEKWQLINKAMLREAQYYHINTVEQLAAISDANVSKMGMGFQDLRRKAQAYLAAAAGEAVADQVERVKRLEAELAELRAERQDPEKRGPGRPRKEPVEA